MPDMSKIAFHFKFYNQTDGTIHLIRKNDGKVVQFNERELFFKELKKGYLLCEIVGKDTKKLGWVNTTPEKWLSRKQEKVSV